MAEIDGLARPMGKLDGREQPMGKLDGRAQSMGKLDGLATKKPRSRPPQACCEAVSAAEYSYGGQRGVWGAAGPPEFF